MWTIQTLSPKGERLPFAVRAVRYRTTPDRRKSSLADFLSPAARRAIARRCAAAPSFHSSVVKVPLPACPTAAKPRQAPAAKRPHAGGGTSPALGWLGRTDLGGKGTRVIRLRRIAVPPAWSCALVSERYHAHRLSPALPARFAGRVSYRTLKLYRTFVRLSSAGAGALAGFCSVRGVSLVGSAPFRQEKG